MGLRITVPPKGRVVINAAVVKNNSAKHQMDLFVENHASVLREKNIMQAEAATTPVRRAFFAAQTIVLENAIEDDAKVRTYLGLLEELAAVFNNPDVVARLDEIRRLAREGAIYKSMMMLRAVMTYEDAVFAHGRLMDLATADAETRAADACDARDAPWADARAPVEA